MPLVKGATDKTRERNIAEMAKTSDMPMKRILAAAYRTQELARKKKRAKP